MPHFRLQYNPDDPWTKTDLIEWAEREEASSRGVPSTGGASGFPDVNAKLYDVLDTYEEDIKRLQETIRSQEAEINRLQQLLDDERTLAFLSLMLLYQI